MFSLPVFGPPSMICVNPLSVTGLISRLQSIVIASRAPGNHWRLQKGLHEMEEFCFFRRRSWGFSCQDTTYGLLPSASSGYDPFSFCCRLCYLWNPMGSQFGGDTLPYWQSCLLFMILATSVPGPLILLPERFIGTRLLTRKSFLCQIWLRSKVKPPT